MNEPCVERKMKKQTEKPQKFWETNDRIPLEFFLRREFSSSDESIPIIRSVMTIGRAFECTIPLRSKRVSRVHCELSCRDRQIYVQDNGSSNGTFINDLLIKGEHKVKVGDLLGFGIAPIPSPQDDDTNFVFSLHKMQSCPTIDLTDDNNAIEDTSIDINRFCKFERDDVTTDVKEIEKDHNYTRPLNRFTMREDEKVENDFIAMAFKDERLDTENESGIINYEELKVTQLASELQNSRDEAEESQTHELELQNQMELSSQKHELDVIDDDKMSSISENLTSRGNLEISLDENIIRENPIQLKSSELNNPKNLINNFSIFNNSFNSTLESVESSNSKLKNFHSIIENSDTDITQNSLNSSSTFKMSENSQKKVKKQKLSKRQLKLRRIINVRNFASVKLREKYEKIKNQNELKSKQIESESELEVFGLNIGETVKKRRNSAKPRRFKMMKEISLFDEFELSEIPQLNLKKVKIRIKKIGRSFFYDENCKKYSINFKNEELKFIDIELKKDFNSQKNSSIKKSTDFDNLSEIKDKTQTKLEEETFKNPKLKLSKSFSKLNQKIKILQQQKKDENSIDGKEFFKYTKKSKNNQKIGPKSSKFNEAAAKYRENRKYQKKSLLENGEKHKKFSKSSSKNLISSNRENESLSTETSNESAVTHSKIILKSRELKKLSKKASNLNLSKSYESFSNNLEKSSYFGSSSDSRMRSLSFESEEPEILQNELDKSSKESSCLIKSDEVNCAGHNCRFDPSHDFDHHKEIIHKNYSESDKNSQLNKIESNFNEIFHQTFKDASNTLVNGENETIKINASKNKAKTTKKYKNRWKKGELNKKKFVRRNIYKLKAKKNEQEIKISGENFKSYKNTLEITENSSKPPKVKRKNSSSSDLQTFSNSIKKFKRNSTFETPKNSFLTSNSQNDLESQKILTSTPRENDKTLQITTERQQFADKAKLTLNPHTTINENYKVNSPLDKLNKEEKIHTQSQAFDSKLSFINASCDAENKNDENLNNEIENSEDEDDLKLSEIRNKLIKEKFKINEQTKSIEKNNLEAVKSGLISETSTDSNFSQLTDSSNLKSDSSLIKNSQKSLISQILNSPMKDVNFPKPVLSESNSESQVKSIFKSKLLDKKPQPSIGQETFTEVKVKRKYVRKNWKRPEEPTKPKIYEKIELTKEHLNQSKLLETLLKADTRKVAEDYFKLTNRQLPTTTSDVQEKIFNENIKYYKDESLESEQIKVLKPLRTYQRLKSKTIKVANLIENEKLEDVNLTSTDVKLSSDSILTQNHLPNKIKSPDVDKNDKPIILSVDKLENNKFDLSLFEGLNNTQNYSQNNGDENIYDGSTLIEFEIEDLNSQITFTEDGLIEITTPNEIVEESHLEIIEHEIAVEESNVESIKEIEDPWVEESEKIIPEIVEDVQEQINESSLKVCDQNNEEVHKEPQSDQKDQNLNLDQITEEIFDYKSTLTIEEFKNIEEDSKNDEVLDTSNKSNSIDIVAVDFAKEMNQKTFDLLKSAVSSLNSLKDVDQNILNSSIEKEIVKNNLDVIDESINFVQNNSESLEIKIDVSLVQNSSEKVDDRFNKDSENLTEKFNLIEESGPVLLEKDNEKSFDSLNVELDIGNEVEIVIESSSNVINESIIIPMEVEEIIEDSVNDDLRNSNEMLQESELRMSEENIVETPNDDSLTIKSQKINYAVENSLKEQPNFIKIDEVKEIINNFECQMKNSSINNEYPLNIESNANLQSTEIEINLNKLNPMNNSDNFKNPVYKSDEVLNFENKKHQITLEELNVVEVKKNKREKTKKDDQKVKKSKKPKISEIEKLKAKETKKEQKEKIKIEKARLKVEKNKIKLEKSKIKSEMLKVKLEKSKQQKIKINKKDKKVEDPNKIKISKVKSRKYKVKDSKLQKNVKQDFVNNSNLQLVLYKVPDQNLSDYLDKIKTNKNLTINAVVPKIDQILPTEINKNRKEDNFSVNTSKNSQKTQQKISLDVEKIENTQNNVSDLDGGQNGSGSPIIKDKASFEVSNFHSQSNNRENVSIICYAKSQKVTFDSIPEIPSFESLQSIKSEIQCNYDQNYEEINSKSYDDDDYISIDSDDDMESYSEKETNRKFEVVYEREDEPPRSILKVKSEKHSKRISFCSSVFVRTFIPDEWCEDDGETDED